MARGRKVGQIELSLDEIDTIIKMSQSKEPEYTRRQIAEAIGRSTITVYRYQKYYGLI